MIGWSKINQILIGQLATIFRIEQNTNKNLTLMSKIGKWELLNEVFE